MSNQVEYVNSFNPDHLCTFSTQYYQYKLSKCCKHKVNNLARLVEHRNSCTMDNYMTNLVILSCFNFEHLHIKDKMLSQRRQHIIEDKLFFKRIFIFKSIKLMLIMYLSNLEKGSNYCKKNQGRSINFIPILLNQNFNLQCTKCRKYNLNSQHILVGKLCEDQLYLLYILGLRWQSGDCEISE